MTNPMFKGKGPSMNKSSYPPAFPLKHQQKDMRLALALGDENAVSMPVAAAANEVSLHKRQEHIDSLLDYIYLLITFESKDICFCFSTGF